MNNGRCPKCGSIEIYFSNSPYPDSIFVRSNTPGLETFTTSADLCLDCGHLEMYVSNTAVALLGEAKHSRKASLPAATGKRSEARSFLAS